MGSGLLSVGGNKPQAPRHRVPDGGLAQVSVAGCAEPPEEGDCHGALRWHFPSGPPKGQACCHTQDVLLWRTERVRFHSFSLQTWPSQGFCSRVGKPVIRIRFGPRGAGHHSGAEGPTGVAHVPHWHWYPVCGLDRGWDPGSFRVLCSGTGGALVGAREEAPQQLGCVSLGETWSRPAKEFWA